MIVSICLPGLGLLCLSFQVCVAVLVDNFVRFSEMEEEKERAKEIEEAKSFQERT